MSFDLSVSLYSGQWLFASILIGAIAIVLGILELIGMWCLLQKMGRHDFAALIPGYDMWEYSRGAGFNGGLSILYVTAFVAFLFCVCGFSAAISPVLRDTFLSIPIDMDAGSLCAVLGSAFMGRLELAIRSFDPWLIGAAIALIVYAVLYIVATFGIAKSFGHGVLCTIGIVIVPFIFLPLLGCSKKQQYANPYFDKSLRGQNDAHKWASAVHARKQAFGSNAPFALSLIGLCMSMVFLPVPSIVLCIIALVRNNKDKGISLAAPKRIATLVISILAIILSIVGTLWLMSLSGSVLNTLASF